MRACHCQWVMRLSVNKKQKVLRMKTDKFLKLFVAVSSLTLASASMLADIIYPPAWSGGPSSSLQTWEFGTSTLGPGWNAPLDTWVVNPSGSVAQPTLSVLQYGWSPTMAGRSGVFSLVGYNLSFAGSMGGQVSLPGQPTDPTKVWLEFTWKQGAPGSPVLASINNLLLSPQTVSVGPNGFGWQHSTYELDLPNTPATVDFWLMGDIFVDDVVVLTQTVPEPGQLAASLVALLGVGGWVVRRRFLKA